MAAQGVCSGVAFEQFIATRLPGLLRHAVVLTGDRELAQDVVQEVLARAQVKWRHIAKADSPDAYVRRMVVNEYLSWRRSWAVRNVRAVGERLDAIGDARATERDHAQTVVDADELWASSTSTSQRCSPRFRHATRSRCGYCLAPSIRRTSCAAPPSSRRSSSVASTKHPSPRLRQNRMRRCPHCARWPATSSFSSPRSRPITRTSCGSSGLRRGRR